MIFENDPGEHKARLYENLDTEFAGSEPEIIVPVLEQYLREFRKKLPENTRHTAEDLHKCKGCIFIVSPDKCKIFMQSTSLMETMFVFRKCCFKELP